MSDTEADGTTYPWAQDLDGVWHLRPADDPWGDPSTDVQAHGVCGSAFGSVHVSTHRPIPEPGLDEGLCAACRHIDDDTRRTNPRPGDPVAANDEEAPR